MDSSTAYRVSNRISAQVGGSSTSGLNGATPLQTKFVISNGSNYKMRWDTMALAVKGCFVKGGTTGTAPPAWNAIADNIEAISLKINDSATNIYECSNGNFVYDYSARLLRNYSWDVLNTMSEELFTPIAGCDELFLGSSTTATGVGAVSVYGGLALPGWKTTSDAGYSQTQYSRFYQNRCGTYTDYTTKMLSFQNVFPRFPMSIMNNVRKVQIDITWRSHYLSCMEKLSGDTTSSYLITNCEIISDFYALTPTSQINDVNEKVGQVVDNVGYLNTQIVDLTYNKGSMSISSVKNLDSVMVFQLARDMVNSVSDRAGSSCGEFCLIDCAKNCLTTTFPTNQSEQVSGKIGSITGVQMQYGEITYPNYELKTMNDGSTSVDMTPLYYEYLKCMNCVANKTAKPMPFEIFMSTMPFICLKCWSNNGTHLTREGKDLILTINSNLTGSVSSSIKIIIFKTQVMQIQPDGSVSVNY